MTDTLVIDPRAWASLSGEATAALPRETGGILLGHRTPGAIHVSQALTVPDARATRVRYRRDFDAAADLLKERLAHDDTGLLGYLGEWHTHPLPIGPSSTDESAIRSLAADGNHDIALLVVALTSRGWRAHCRLAKPDGRIQPCTFAPPGEST